MYRAVFIFRDVEELSTDETAQILDVSAEVVKTRLHRARLALRQQIGSTSADVERSASRMSPKECRDVFEMLSEYLDGDLPEGTCEQIEQHIADCPPCIEFLKSLRKSVKLCRGYTPPEAPPPLSADAKERLAEAYRQMLARNKSTRSARSSSRSPSRRLRTWSANRSGRRAASSCTSVVIRRAPLAPSGWPSATAPPFTFTLARSALVSRCHASTTLANASLISIRSISSSLQPGALEYPPRGWNRSRQHQHRIVARQRKCHETRQRPSVPGAPPFRAP